MSITLKPEYSNSLKKNIANSPALHIKCIYSTATEYTKHSKALGNALVKNGYQHKNVKKEIEKAVDEERENLLNKTKEFK